MYSFQSIAASSNSWKFASAKFFRGYICAFECAFLAHCEPCLRESNFLLVKVQKARYGKSQGRGGGNLDGGRVLEKYFKFQENQEEGLRKMF